MSTGPLVAQLKAHKKQIRTLERENRQLKKTAAETMAKDQQIDLLQQQLKKLKKKSKIYKKQRPPGLHEFKNDPSARTLIQIVTKEVSAPSSGNPKISIESATQIFRPLDKKGNPITTTITTKKRKRSASSSELRRPVNQIEQEVKFAGFLGKELRHIMVLPHVDATDAETDGGIVGISGYQKTMVNDTSPLHALTHAMGTGEQSPSNTTREFIDKNSYQQRSEMKAFNGMCAILAAVSDQTKTPLTTLMTNVLQTYKGQVASRVRHVFNRIGLAKQAKQMSAAAAKQLEMNSRIIMEDPELFSVFRLITDNVGFTNTVGSYNEYSMRGVSTFSPAELVAWWGKELYIELGEDYKPVKQEKFLERYKTPQMLANPQYADWSLQGQAEKARIVCAIEAYGKMLKVNRYVFNELENAETDKKTLDQRTSQFTNIKVPTAYAAGIKGASDDCTVSLPTEAHRRRPFSTSKIPISRFNKLDSLDVIFEQVSNRKGVQRTMEALECEARLLPTYDLRKKYEPTDDEGKLLRRSVEELQKPYHSGTEEEDGSSGGGTGGGSSGSGSGSGHGSNGSSGSSGSSGSDHGSTSSASEDIDNVGGSSGSGNQRKKKKKKRRRKRRRKSGRKKNGGSKRKRNEIEENDDNHDVEQFLKEQLIPEVRKAAKTMKGRALYLSDNSPNLIMAKLRDENATGIIADMYSGGFHMLKKVLASTGLLFDDFVNDMIDPLRLTAAFKTYYAVGSDPRQRWTEEPQLAIGQTIAMVHGYQQYLDAQAEERDDDEPAEKVDVNKPGEWKKVYDYVKELIDEHGRISLVPMLFWLRCCDLASMLRSCGKAMPSGDFELYRRLIRLCRILFALTNSMKYIRVTFDVQIFLETCNKIDYLIAKEIAFTGRTATDRPQFMDELQEKLVQIIRILSGGAAGGKKMSPMVETDMRPRVRDWENVLHQMRTVLHELGVEEDQTNVSFEHQMLAENAPEQYDGQFLDDQTEKLDEKIIQEDKWRNKPIGPFVLVAIQWAVQHGLYNPDPAMFVDKSGTVIEPHTFVSIASGKSMSLDQLALPLIGVEKLKTYCGKNYGDWIPIEEQNRRKTKRSRRTVNRDTNESIAVAEDETIHGPKLVLGRFIGKAVRTGDTKEFKGIAIQQKETDEIDRVYAQRRTTQETSAILNKKTIGNTGMRLFENKGELVAEINRVIDDYGTEKTHKKSIKKYVLSKLDAGETRIPTDTNIKRKKLAQMIVSLRENKVPCSLFLEEDGRPIHVKKMHNHYYYSTLDGTKVTKQFKPLDQDFLKNTLCSCSDAECICEAVNSPVQLCPAVIEPIDVVVDSEEEEEEVVAVETNATVSEVLAISLGLLHN